MSLVRREQQQQEELELSPAEQSLAHERVTSAECERDTRIAASTQARYLIILFRLRRGLLPPPSPARPGRQRPPSRNSGE